jgi:hypothetical protein
MFVKGFVKGCVLRVCRLIRELRQGGQSSARNDEQIVGECRPLFQPFRRMVLGRRGLPLGARLGRSDER